MLKVYGMFVEIESPSDLSSSANFMTMTVGVC